MPARVPMPASFKTLADSWMLQLRAEGKSPATLTNYGRSVRLFAAWLDALPADGQRRRMKRADDEHLWIGRLGPMKKRAIYKMLRERSDAAGLGKVHPHQLRHSIAHAWLEAGGSEGDLMKARRLDGAGHASPLRRRLQPNAPARAHRRLALGDRL